MDKLEKSRQLLSTAILQNFVGRITGAGLDRIVGNNPENVLLVGKLMSTNDADGQNTNSSKTFIESIGVDFYVAEKEMDNAVIKLFPQGDFYYRAVPTIEEQRTAMIREINESRDENEFKSFEDVVDAYKTNPASFSNYQIRLVPVYKKISLRENAQVSFRLKDIIDESGECGFVGESHRINGEVESYLQGVQANINNDREAMKQVITELTRVEHLLSDANYSSFLKTYANKKVQQQNQNWKVYFDIQVKRIGTNYLVSCFLVNNSVVLYSGAHRSRKDDKFTVETLFNSGIRVELNNASFCPIELDFFEDDYKYEKTQYALSNNCAVEFVKAENALKTNHLPLYEQYRLITNDSLAVKFLDLVDDPIVTLEGILAKMRKELEVWKQYKKQKTPELTEKGKEKLSKEIQGFEDEILNFASGIYVLKSYPIVRKSFVQMNKAFAETSKKYSTWRLFQIVFIVSMIPDIAACDRDLMPDDEKAKTHLSDMALLYFPTGGGKTEAFLGVLVFNLFFDRHRGKSCGVTSILRYPLRLLSVQQVQRLANVLAKAELIRRADNEIQYTSGSLFFMKNIKKAIKEHEIVKDTIKDHLYKSFGCTDDDGTTHDLGNQYRQKIDAFVDEVFVQIEDRSWSDETIFDGFRLMGYRIMNSLRDTDSQLIIELD